MLRHTGTETKKFETSVNVPEQVSTFKVHMTRKINNISANNEVIQLKVGRDQLLPFSTQQGKIPGLI